MWNTKLNKQIKLKLIDMNLSSSFAQYVLSLDSPSSNMSSSSSSSSPALSKAEKLKKQKEEAERLQQQIAIAEAQEGTPSEVASITNRIENIALKFGDDDLLKQELDFAVDEDWESENDVKKLHAMLKKYEDAYRQLVVREWRMRVAYCEKRREIKKVLGDKDEEKVKAVQEVKKSAAAAIATSHGSCGCKKTYCASKRCGCQVDRVACNWSKTGCTHCTKDSCLNPYSFPNNPEQLHINRVSIAASEDSKIQQANVNDLNKLML